MKIDKSRIELNANKLVNAAAMDVWDCIGDENSAQITLANLAYIRGVLNMAEAMKSVLEV